MQLPQLHAPEARRARGRIPGSRRGAVSPAEGVRLTLAARPLRVELRRPLLSADTRISSSWRRYERDISQGIIRIPRATKELFPAEPSDVDVDLRGKRMTCSYHPRFGNRGNRSTRAN